MYTFDMSGILILPEDLGTYRNDQFCNKYSIIKSKIVHSLE